MTLDFARALNPQQFLACTHTGSPLLILAGAGSGKTRVLTHRIAFLSSECAIPTSNILAVTFTNKAANEMRERATSLMIRAGISNAPLPWIGTFHGICARLLRQHGHRVGLAPGFTIYDDDDSLGVLRDCVKETKWPDDRASLKALSSFIDSCKNAGESPDLVRDLAYTHSNIQRANIYALYNQRLRKANAVDFGDLILLVNQLLSSHEPTRLYISRNWQHILVDEFQDTNGVQYNLLRLLSRDHNALTVVGDDDQSIYAWRGANVNYMLGFEKDYPTAKVVKLEQNYRSTAHILKLSSDLIQHNRARHPKRLWTDQTDPSAPPVSFLCAADEHEEARFITRAISSWRSASPPTYPAIAILFRTHAQTRVIEDALRSSSLPYKLVGGLSFYNRAEIKDALAYLRLLVNDTDLMAMRRIINTPPRGIGDQTQDTLESFISEHANNSIYEGLRLVAIDGQGPFTTRNRKAIREFFETLRRWRELLPASPLHHPQSRPPRHLLPRLPRQTRPRTRHRNQRKRPRTHHRPRRLRALPPRPLPPPIPRRLPPQRPPRRRTLPPLPQRPPSHPTHDHPQRQRPRIRRRLRLRLRTTPHAPPTPRRPPRQPRRRTPPRLRRLHPRPPLPHPHLHPNAPHLRPNPLPKPQHLPLRTRPQRPQHHLPKHPHLPRLLPQTHYTFPQNTSISPKTLRIYSPQTLRLLPPKTPIPSPSSSQPSPKPRFLESRSDLSPGDSVNHARFGSGQVLSLEPRAGQIIATVDFPLAGIKKVVTSFLQKL